MIRKMLKKVNPVTFTLGSTFFIFGALLGLVVLILNYTYAANITVYNGTLLDIKVSLTQDYSNINVNLTFGSLSNGKIIEISKDYTCINNVRNDILDKFTIGKNSIIYEQKSLYDIYDKKGFVKAFGFFSIISLSLGLILLGCSFISCEKKTYVSV
jgi:hypothetical protein